MACTVESRARRWCARPVGNRDRPLRRHCGAALPVEVLARSAGTGGVGRMLNRTIRRRDGVDVDALAGDLHPLLRRLYAARGVRLASELDLGLNQLVPVGRLDGVAAAVELLCAHFQKRSAVVVIGDFDADGATSTALVVRQLRRLGFAAVDFLVPNRFQYGYGLTPEIVRLAAQNQPQLIVTVDNGVSSHAGVDEARALGIDTLITDHHLAPPTLPNATALVNPNV